MKKIKNLNLILALILTISLISCNKEEVNKVNSLSTKSSLILGDWILYETIEGDGTVYTLPADEIIKWKFEANGVFTEIHDYHTTYDSSTYKWELTNYDRNLKIIDEIDSDSSENPIAKLTSSELWFIDDSDGYQVHFGKK